jgi:hypothetical protein
MLSRDLDLDVSLLWNFFGYALRARPLVGGLDQATAEADLGPFSPGCINRPSTGISLCAAALRSSKASSMHDFMSSLKLTVKANGAEDRSAGLKNGLHDDTGSGGRPCRVREDSFSVEALLQDWVVDRKGRPRDLLIMSDELEGLSDQVTA